MMEQVEHSCRAFVGALASSAPTPGGGGAAAMVGAIGVSLGNMVGALSVGKKKFIPVEPELRAAMAACDRLQEALLAQVQADADCFAPLASAYAIPKDDPTRALRMEKATLDACTAPMEILRLCAEAVSLIEIFAQKGSRLALSDAGCGAVLCKAAMQAASLNLWINTGALRDRAAADRLNREADGYLAACDRAEAVFRQVRDAL